MTITSESPASPTKGEASFKSDLSVFEGLFPRPEGSANEVLAFSYIENSLASMGLISRSLDFSEQVEGYSRSKILYVDIPGKRDERIVIAVPVNHSQDAKARADGSWGLALVLELARHWAKAQPETAIRLLFLGAEYPGLPGSQAGSYALGSKRYLSLPWDSGSSFAVYVNILAKPNSLRLRNGATGQLSPFWLLSKSVEAGKASGMRLDVLGTMGVIYRLALNDDIPLIEPWLASDYPAIEIEGGSVGTINDDGALLGFSSFFSSLVKSCEQGFPNTWDRHYLLLQSGEIIVELSEGVIVIVLLCVISLGTIILLVYSVLRRRRMIVDSNRALRRSWLLPLGYISLLGALYMASTLSLALFDSFALDAQSPSYVFAALALKFSLTIFVFSAMWDIGRLAFPHHSERSMAVYATVLFALDSIIFAFLNLSFSFFFLFSFVVSFAYVPTKRKILKILLILLCPLWIFSLFFDMAILGGGASNHSSGTPIRLLDAFLSGNFVELSFLCFIILPFLFMILSYDLYRRSKTRDKSKSLLHRSPIRVFTIVFLGLSLLFAFLPLVMDPWNAKNPQPIRYSEFDDLSLGKASVQVKSEAPFGSTKVSRDGKEIALPPGAREFSTSLKSISSPVKPSIVFNSFLDRSNIEINLVSEGAPYLIECAITSTTELLIYNCNYPYKTSSSGREATIYIGQFPESPLSLKLTLSNDTKAEAVFTVHYSNPPFPLYLIEKGKTIGSSADSGLRFQSSCDFKVRIPLTR